MEATQTRSLDAWIDRLTRSEIPVLRRTEELLSVMRGDFDQLVEDLLLAKVCNMNFLRLTQRPVQSEIYDYADMLGLMLQSDLPFFGVVRRNTVCEAIRQAAEMERLVRNSPASIMVTYINEPFQNAHGKPERHLQRPKSYQKRNRLLRA
ncbi:MAG: hypothetical protein EBV35_07085 [Betaproteobacteria bacterium]|nr:hypothetical protein [Betaproteobacteria bacterium]